MKYGLAPEKTSDQQSSISAYACKRIRVVWLWYLQEQNVSKHGLAPEKTSDQQSSISPCACKRIRAVCLGFLQ